MTFIDKQLNIATAGVSRQGTIGDLKLMSSSWTFG